MINPFDRIGYEGIAAAAGFTITGLLNIEATPHGYAADIEANSIEYKGLKVAALRIRLNGSQVSITARMAVLSLEFDGDDLVTGSR